MSPRLNIVAGHVSLESELDAERITVSFLCKDKQQALVLYGAIYDGLEVNHIDIKFAEER